MLADVRRAIGAPRRLLVGAPDAGFTLIEVLVSSMLIGIVMTGLTAFFVVTASATSQQGSRQAAVQLADGATDLVRAVKGHEVASGRDQTSTVNQWASPVAGVAPYLASMAQTWDDSASYPDGATAPIPTTAKSTTLGGLVYSQNWYVGKCWQPPAGGGCGATPVTGYVEFFRVVVAVTWSDKHCPGSECSYVTSTLVSSVAAEPVFDPDGTGS